MQTRSSEIQCFTIVCFLKINYSTQNLVTTVHWGPISCVLFAFLKQKRVYKHRQVVPTSSNFLILDTSPFPVHSQVQNKRLQLRNISSTILHCCSINIERNFYVNRRSILQKLAQNPMATLRLLREQDNSFSLVFLNKRIYVSRRVIHV